MQKNFRYTFLLNIYIYANEKNIYVTNRKYEIIFFSL